MKKKWWVIPITLIGAFVLEMVLYLVITFSIYIFTESSMIEQIVGDVLFFIVSLVVFLVFSYFVYYVLMPYIFIESGLNYKVISIILFVWFTFTSVIQCLYMSDCYYPDFLDYFAFCSLTNNLPIFFYSEGILAVVNVVLIFAVNLIRPIFFTVSSYKSVKEKAV